MDKTSKKIIYQRLVAQLLKLSSKEQAENIELMTELDGNDYKFGLYTSTVLCHIGNQPEELEMAMLRYGVYVELGCDVVLRDALLFDVKSNDYYVRGSGKIILSDKYHPGIKTYIVRDEDIICKDNNVKVPAKIKSMIESPDRTVDGVINYITYNYYSDFETVYNFRMRTFIRIAAKAGVMRLQFGGVVISVYGFNYKVSVDKEVVLNYAERLFHKKVCEIIASLK